MRPCFGLKRVLKRDVQLLRTMFTAGILQRDINIACEVVHLFHLELLAYGRTS
jgi:hypothetical protein